MDKTVTPKAGAEVNENTNWETAFQECIAEMERANERMNQRQEEIEKLKAETQAIITRLKAA